MVPETMEILIEEVKKINPEQLFWAYTGGGEPFRNPMITELIESPLRPLGGKMAKLRIVTSGFLPKNEDEIERFIRLIEKPFSGFLQILLSFNLFNPQFPRRLKNTLALIMNHRSRAGFTFIRLCLSCEGFGRSYRSLEKVLNDFCSDTHSEILPMFAEIPKSQMDSAISFFLPERQLIAKKNFPGEEDGEQWEWIKERWSEDREGKMIDEAHLYDLFCWASNPMRGVFPLIIQPIPLLKIGRAKKIRQTPLRYFYCDSIMGRPDNGSERIIVGADGSLYPQMQCCGSQRMSLGKLGKDSLREALDRKREFSSVALKEILADGRMFDEESNGICEVCKSIKSRLKL
jgi:hypothetical protein